MAGAVALALAEAYTWLMLSIQNTHRNLAALCILSLARPGTAQDNGAAVLARVDSMVALLTNDSGPGTADYNGLIAARNKILQDFRHLAPADQLYVYRHLFESLAANTTPASLNRAEFLLEALPADQEAREFFSDSRYNQLVTQAKSCAEQQNNLPRVRLVGFKFWERLAPTSPQIAKLSFDFYQQLVALESSPTRASMGFAHGELIKLRIQTLAMIGRHAQGITDMQEAVLSWMWDERIVVNYPALSGQLCILAAQMSQVCTGEAGSRFRAKVRQAVLEFNKHLIGESPAICGSGFILSRGDFVTLGEKFMQAVAICPAAADVATLKAVALKAIDNPEFVNTISYTCKAIGQLRTVELAERRAVLLELIDNLDAQTREFPMMDVVRSEVKEVIRTLR